MLDGPNGLKIVCGASGISRIASIERGRLDELARQVCRVAAQFDVIVLDTGAGIGREVLRLLMLADEIVVVATPNLASTLDAYGVIKAAHEANVSGNFGVLANQARSEAEAHVVRERLVSCAGQFLKIALRDLGWLPRAPRIESANQGRHAIVEISPDSEVSRRFRAIATEFLPQCGGSGSVAEPAAA